MGVSRLQHIRNDEIRKQMGQQDTLCAKVQRKRLKWFGHITRMDGKRLPTRALHCHIEGARSRGRQPKTWMDNVKEDLKEHGLGMRTATEWARDRKRWRHLVQPHRQHRWWTRRKEEEDICIFVYVYIVWYFSAVLLMSGQPRYYLVVLLMSGRHPHDALSERATMILFGYFIDELAILILMSGRHPPWRTMWAGNPDIILLFYWWAGDPPPRGERSERASLILFGCFIEERATFILMSVRHPLISARREYISILKSISILVY